MYSHLRYSVRNGNDNEMESFTLQESVKHEDCNQAQHGALYSRWLEDRERGQREYSSRFISQLRAEARAHQRAGTCVCRAADGSRGICDCGSVASYVGTAAETDRGSSEPQITVKKTSCFCGRIRENPGFTNQPGGRT